jgi:hypothetical protein
MADLTTRYQIPKLNEKNYSIWAMMVENAAHSMMAYPLLVTKVAIPSVPKDKSNEDIITAYKTFYSLLTLLMTSISEPCLYIIWTKSSTPNDVWVTLREHFLPSTNRNVIRLRGIFYRTSLQSVGSMARYIDSINTQAADINALLEEIHQKSTPISSSSLSSSAPAAPPLITDMEKLTVLLYGLGDDYNTTREILENDQQISYEIACMRLKEKAESGQNSSPSNLSSLSASSDALNGYQDQANAAGAING